jgi:mannitol-1-phosphate 5-dehydrogenase
MQCVERGIAPEYLGLAIAAALLFDYSHDSAARCIQSDISQLGLPQALRIYTGIPAGHMLEGIVLRHVDALREAASARNGKAGV